MAYIVKCPHCNEVNIGSAFHCIKCNTNLIGIPREQGVSPIPEFIKTQNPKEDNGVLTKIEHKKLIASGISISFYIFTAFIPIIKSLLQHVKTYQILGGTLLFFIAGLIFYLTPAHILYHIEIGSGFFRPRLGFFETSKFDQARISYIISGIMLMFFAIVINVTSALFTE